MSEHGLTMPPLISSTTTNGSAPRAAGETIWFTPGLAAPDAYTAYWIRQAVLRLRRELCWAWRQAQTPDPVSEAIDRSRLHEQRLEFFARDETARYMTQALSQAPPLMPSVCA